MNKKGVIFMAAACFIMLWIILVIYINMQKYSIGWEFIAGEQELDNPARGFYIQLGTSNMELLSAVRKENVRLVLTAFDIAAYTECEIAEEKLKELDDFLTRLDELGMQAIFRAAYGFENTGDNDADSMERIEEHILQIAPILNKHKRTIYCVQAGFLGPWGEWHSSIFLEGRTSEEQKENRNQILRLLLEHLDESMVLNVRRPRFIRDAKEAELDTERIGFHDDGLLASDTDLGTYDDEEYSREAELAWLKKRNVGINGGEMPMLSAFTEVDIAVREFADIQVSYLNKRYHMDVLEDWKGKTVGEKVERNSCFVPQASQVVLCFRHGTEENAYEYIQKRLGYRLYASELSYCETWRKGSVHIWLANEGFSTLPKRYQAAIVLEKEDGAIAELPMTAKDLKKLTSLKQGEYMEFQTDVPEEFRKVSFQVGVKIYDKEDERNVVELSNQENKFINGINYLHEIIREEG